MACFYVSGFSLSLDVRVVPCRIHDFTEQSILWGITHFFMEHFSDVLRSIYFYPLQIFLGFFFFCLSRTEITRGGEVNLASVSEDLCQDFLCTL